MKDERGKLGHTNMESKLYFSVCVSVCNLDSLYMKLPNKAQKNGTIYQSIPTFPVQKQGSSYQKFYQPRREGSEVICPYMWACWGMD